MTALGPVAWPPAPIRTERLVLRAAEARDRATFVELLASPEVHTYLGGPRQRDELEREVPAVPEPWPGSFVVELDGRMIGQVLVRRVTEHRTAAAVGKVDLGYQNSFAVIGLQAGGEANLLVATRSVADSGPAEPDGVVLCLGRGASRGLFRFSRVVLTPVGSAVRCTA
ncbi:GNAT family N-acetyltransferase [Streptomyces sp. NPDC056628]|uniref:GNAT family N-acetyltransferase n=1 Tax=Streptomyces sp. NPDC056628 TaxID=3345882 RepID=UPI00369ACD3E